MIETVRILLRKFTLDDVDGAFRFLSNEEVSRYTGDAGQVKTLGDAKKVITDVWFHDYEKYGYGRLALVWKETGEVIGFCGLKYLEDLNKVDLGYRMIPSFWGKGIATESSQALLEYVKEHMDISEVIGIVDLENSASENVLKKLGFQFTEETDYHGIAVRILNLSLK